MPLGLFRTDAAGRIVYVNDSYLRVHGLHDLPGDFWIIRRNQVTPAALTVPRPLDVAAGRRAVLLRTGAQEIGEDGSERAHGGSLP